MPEMTAMPILPSAAPPANSLSGSKGLAAQKEDSLASTQATSQSGPSMQTAAPANDESSFASLLKRQLEQAAPTQLSAAAATTDANIRSITDIAALLDMTKTLPEAAMAIDPNAKALLDAAMAIDPNAKALLDAAMAIDPNAKALPDAAMAIDPNTNALPDAGLLAIATNTGTVVIPSQSARNTADETGQEMPVDNLAALSPYLLTLTNNSSAKTETDSPDTLIPEKDGSAKSGGSAVLQAASMIGLSGTDDKEMASPKPVENQQTAANKTAEFAAGLAVLPEIAPSSAKTTESAASESNFENMLAAAQAAHQNRSAAVHAANRSDPALPVETPVGTRGWDGEVGDKLVWMVGQKEQRAELVLNPPHLGRVEVSLSMKEGQTSAMFVSANPAVRDALEAALPRLREILADAGVTLGQTQVGAETGSNQASNQSTNDRENWDNLRRGPNSFDLANGADLMRPVGASQWLRQSNSLVDVFA